jgi:hypothetical protein
MPRTITIRARLYAIVDDLLEPEAPFAPDRRCVGIPEQLRERVVAFLSNDEESCLGSLMMHVKARRGPASCLSLGPRRRRVPLQLVRSEVGEFDSLGRLSVAFEWTESNYKLRSTSIDETCVLETLSGNIVDGWGESVAQKCRFGELVAEDAEGRLAVASEARASELRLQPEEDGRYAVLFTLDEATVSVE